MPPKITIITPSFNQKEFLDECLRSVHGQTYPAVEHIVVDGGSQDGSKELIERYTDRLAWWCSERDRGQSDAINKGLEHASGAVFGWLNSDDLYLPGALAAVGEAFLADPEMRVFQGHRVLLHPNGDRERSVLNDPGQPGTLFTAPSVDQQATFYRMDAVREVGGVDPALHYCMDLDLWWRVLFAFGTDKVRTSAVDLAVFRLQPESKTAQGTAGFVLETAALLHAMAMATVQEDLAALLRLGHPDLPVVRKSNAREAHASIVRRMVYRFLVKWHASLATPSEFAMLKRLRSIAGKDLALGEGSLDQRWKELYPSLGAPEWNSFRLGRKLGLWKV